MTFSEWYVFVEVAPKTELHKICLILSTENNWVGLIAYISFYCLNIANVGTSLFKNKSIE